jgi:autotransporter-associated beta strand protein
LRGQASPRGQWPTSPWSCGHTGSNYIFAPTISGAATGTVEVDAGTTILTANNTYTGATAINGGALIVNGSIASSALTTVNGGLLGGVGTVGNTQINAGGTFAPGPQSAPGSMTVAGNLAFQPGAFYLVQVNPTAASIANVTGTTTLAGNVLANFAPGSTPCPLALRDRPRAGPNFVKKPCAGPRSRPSDSGVPRAVSP